MSGLFDQIRFRALKLVYDSFFVIMVRDASWQEPLFASIAPEANSRVLNFGPGSVWTARTLALRFPGANFIGADPNPKAVQKGRRSIARRNISNLKVIEAPRDGRLPFDASSFDKVVLVLALHDRPPEEKLGIAKEMLRILRPGGTSHVADYDKPAAPGEGAVLKLARYISGQAAAEPHMDGSWTEFLAKAGFAGIRRQSSHSVKVGRISVVKARKPDSILRIVSLRQVRALSFRFGPGIEIIGVGCSLVIFRVSTAERHQAGVAE